MNLMISANQRAAFHTWLCVSVHSSHLGGRVRSPCRSDGSDRRKRKQPPLPHPHWDRLRHGAGQSQHQVGWLTAAEVRCVQWTDGAASVLSACRRWSCRTSCPASWWTTPTGGGASTTARWVTANLQVFQNHLTLQRGLGESVQTRSICRFRFWCLSRQDQTEQPPRRLLWINLYLNVWRPTGEVRRLGAPRCFGSRRD